MQPLTQDVQTRPRQDKHGSTPSYRTRVILRWRGCQDEGRAGVQLLPAHAEQGLQQLIARDLLVSKGVLTQTLVQILKQVKKFQNTLRQDRRLYLCGMRSFGGPVLEIFTRISQAWYCNL